ncbi:MAG: chorismate lyase [Oleiphilaceae bacterium]|nr:chorismate lyase [Oleiphilaceae bacterium]
MTGLFRPRPAFRLPRPQRAIIRHQGSLTRLLKQLSREGFRVRVLQQGMARPQPDEALFLGLTPRQRVWVREVQLEGDGQGWVRARTLVPLATLRGPERSLRQLGRRPLGSALFRRDPWQRARFVTGETPAGGREPLWGRRSRFCRRGRQLLVTEYFQPAFWQALSKRDWHFHRVRADARRPL